MPTLQLGRKVQTTLHQAASSFLFSPVALSRLFCRRRMSRGPFGPFCLRSFKVDTFCNARSAPVASVDETTESRFGWCMAIASAPYNYGESQSPRHGAYRFAWTRTSTRALAAASILEILLRTWGLTRSYLNNRQIICAPKFV